MRANMHDWKRGGAKIAGNGVGVDAFRVPCIRECVSALRYDRIELETQIACSNHFMHGPVQQVWSYGNSQSFADQAIAQEAAVQRPVGVGFQKQIFLVASGPERRCKIQPDIRQMADHFAEAYSWRELPINDRRIVQLILVDSQLLRHIDVDILDAERPQFTRA